MTRYRFRFAITGLLRFLSHLDLMRTIERAMRRANLPLALTQGFHPRPKLNFASALAVGISSSDEYFDVELTAPMEPEEIKERLNAVLPGDLKILACREVSLQARPLMAIVDTAAYVMTPGEEDALARVPELLEARTLPIQRTTKRGTNEVDVRPLLLDLQVQDGQLKLLARTGSKGNLRPEELLRLLGTDHRVWQIHRQGLYVTRDGQLKSPMDVDR
ncbi:MAG: TIGR03936 family radical SAM-associated protein [Limnochordia bacterium]|jgi:radical SAM-linked protein